MPSCTAVSEHVFEPAPFPFENVQKVIRRIRPDLAPESLTYSCAVILLLGTRLGNNIDRVARVTGYPRSLIARAARRLNDDGVWRGTETDAAWTSGLDEEAFWNDVGVAEGTLHRISRGRNEFVWVATGEVWKSYEFVSAANELLATTEYHPVPQNRFDIPNIYEEDESLESEAVELKEPAQEPWRLRIPSPVERVYAGTPSCQKEMTPLPASGGVDLFPDAVWLT